MFLFLVFLKKSAFRAQNSCKIKRLMPFLKLDPLQTLHINLASRMAKTVNSWKKMKLETRDWKLHDESSVIERPDVFFVVQIHPWYVKCSPPPSKPRWFSAFARCKKTTCAEIWSSWDVARRLIRFQLRKNRPWREKHSVWRQNILLNTVTVGWEFHELLSKNMLQGLKSRVSLLKSRVSLRKTGLFSLKNILAQYMHNGRQVRLYVLVGTWTNEIPHWKPFFTNVKATVQSIPQWSMFSAVQEMSSEYKKHLYIKKSLIPMKQPSGLGMSRGFWVLNAVHLHPAIFL